MKFSCEVISNGRITIPKHIREKMRIGQGDIVLLAVVEVVKAGEDE